MSHNREIDYAYCAGSIDSDGYITIQRTRRAVGVVYAHQPVYYSAKIGFTSTAQILRGNVWWLRLRIPAKESDP